MSDDYEVGYKRPPKQTRWKKGESGNGGRRRSRRPLRLIEVIDKLLLTPVTVTENGLASQMPTVGAIVLQLLRKELSGNRRALTVRLAYEALAQQYAERKLEVRFVDSDYTQALSSPPSSEATEDGKV
jgi:Family of unknown function (DUF5681)